MRLKKLVCIGMAFLSLISFALAGCSSSESTGGNTSDPSDEPALRLRSPTEQELKVGDSMTIVYNVANTEQGVSFTSSDEEVVTVSAYGEVEAVGVGEATVTLALVEAPSETASIRYTVTKDFFIDRNGYRNGSVDLTAQETGGDVLITGGQAQILVNEPGDTWYFSVHLEHGGAVQGDTAGGWGVGSFLVNAAYPIGEVMYWYALRRANDSDTQAQLYYGGWRYDESVTESREELVSDEVIDTSNGVDFTLYRKGITHYMILEYTAADGETHTIKHSYDVPLFEVYDTYPGVFGQNQVVTVSDYTSTSDPEEVDELLAQFQRAESVSINVLDDRLVKGQSYELTSTVLPAYTIDKSVTYTLDTAAAGVTLTDGVLTVDEKCTASEITVVATANSAPGVTDRKTYRIVAKPQSSSTLFDTGMAIGEVSFDGTSAETEGAAYIPLIASGNTWYVSAKVNSSVRDTEAGLMGASAGYTYRSSFGVCYAYDTLGAALYNELGGTTQSYADSANGLLASDSSNELGLLRQGSDYTLFINGKMVDRFTTYDGAVIPVLYTTAAATFTDVSVTSDEETIAQLLADNPFFTGTYVSRSGDDGNVYTLSNRDFGSANNMNWPPVNGYQNGLKYAQSVTGYYEISFTMSDISPRRLSDYTIDAKILVYLQSETPTSSIQFIIKEYEGVQQMRLVVNLDDATWTEHVIPESVISNESLLNGQTQVRIVRSETCVEIYLNGVRVFEGETFMRNNNYWNETTASTPGIGSFLCGVTITDPVVKSVTKS